MNDRLSESGETRFEARLREMSGGFAYPPTPDVSRRVSGRLQAAPALRPVLRRRWVMAAAALLVLALAALLATPPARAALIQFIRVGAIRIFLAAPTPSPTPAATPSSPAAAPQTPGLPAGQPPAAGAALPPTATPALESVATPADLVPVTALAGETSLAKAQARLGFPIRLPAYPADLGAPQRVFLQTLGGGEMVILAWMDPGQPERVRLSLHELGPGAFAEKFEPKILQTTTVGDQPALWTEGPYLLKYKNGDTDIRRLIDGNVLVWTDGDITYRIETDLPLEEARKIAESLH